MSPDNGAGNCVQRVVPRTWLAADSERLGTRHAWSSSRGSHSSPTCLPNHIGGHQNCKHVRCTVLTPRPPINTGETNVPAPTCCSPQSLEGRDVPLQFNTLQGPQVVHRKLQVRENKHPQPKSNRDRACMEAMREHDSTINCSALAQRQPVPRRHRHPAG